MDNASRKAVIERYLAAYNAFDIDGMLAVLTPDVRFENVAGGTVNAEASGIDAFRSLAEQGRRLFSARAQRLGGLAFDGDTAYADIDWRGTFAVDVPDGPRAGTTLELRGHSAFTFVGERIAKLVDRS
ncbi:nuclear transport factor 2 family protein [Herbaspirillum sp. SJZ107]|uniref:nuclear transport factor 2 family protein n=1 Tax=Herbaspirillum sp. SJZ107 TaxID=2572881 RepID=UPI00114E60DD|nr:nuclear transport factor 2 family protein [Herbaspirillum sp. SJZ107]TQK11738.1 SnoaL-like protein [Herbaspirillum sp. SJZ107]